MSDVAMKLKAALQNIINVCQQQKKKKVSELLSIQPIVLPEDKCNVEEGNLKKADNAPLTELGLRPDMLNPRHKLVSSSHNNYHMALQLNIDSPNVLCLDKTLLTTILPLTLSFPFFRKSQSIDGTQNHVLGAYESEISKTYSADDLNRILLNALLYLGGGFTFHYSPKHSNTMFIICKIDEHYAIKVDLQSSIPTINISKITHYAETLFGRASEKQNQQATKDILIKLQSIEGNPQCFQIQQGGALINPKAKVMHRIRLTSPTPPEVFIIGKYAHPRAPYIVLPAMRSWITKTQITFPVTDGKSKLVVYRKGNQLIAPTPGNKNDVFIVSHIVNKRGQRGGGLTIVVDDPTPNVKCVANKIPLTKEGDNTYIGLTDKTITFENGFLTIGEQQVPVYPYNEKAPTTIILHKHPESSEYIMAEGLPEPQVPTVE